MKFLKKRRNKLYRKIKNNWLEIFVILASFVFAWWLMWHTFDYRHGQLMIASKAWSDFGATIPLIRSFSFGNNWPPQYPLFPNQPINYHFLFYLLVGLFEKIGLPLGWSLNLISSLSFFFLMVVIFFLAKKIFKKSEVGFLSVIFFLFNGSLSFLEFFRLYPLSIKTPQQISKNLVFPSFGPYDQKTISAFWNLNIYTNQRHLAAAYAGSLIIILFLLNSLNKKKKISPVKIVILAITIGLFPFFHKAIFAILIMILICFFLLFPKLRRHVFVTLLLGGLIALPQIIYQASFQATQNMISFNPGYLTQKPLTTLGFINYWILNLGLSFFLIPLGFLTSPKIARKVFLSIFPLFIIGNLFQFSPEISANHKFFNLFIIVGNMFSAWFIYLLWQKKRLNIVFKGLVIVLIFLSTLSGIIDFFPIKNDYFILITDAPKNKDISWIKNYTPPDSIFLNSTYFYHPASLAGRKIFLGWPYFPWSVGYDTVQRSKVIEEIYSGKEKEKVCQLLLENNIDYLSIGKTTKDPSLPKVNQAFFSKNFLPIYFNQESSLKIFAVNDNCQ